MGADSKPLNKLVQLVYTYAEDYLRTELLVHQTVVECIIFLYFAAYIGTTSRLTNTLQQLLAAHREAYHLEGVVISSIFALLLIALQILLFVDKLSQVQRMSLMRINIYMTITFTYIIYPLQIWSWFSLFLHMEHMSVLKQTILCLTGALLLICSSLIHAINLIFCRNSIPSNSISTASVDHFREYFIHFLNSLVIVLSALQSYQDQSGLIQRIGICVACAAIQGTSVFLIMKKWIFWKPELNHAYSSMFIVVYCLKTISDVFEIVESPQLKIGVTLCLLGLFFKAGHMISTQATVMVNFLDPTLDAETKVHGMIHYEHLFVKHKEGRLKPEESLSYIFYKGLIARYLQDHRGHDSASDGDSDPHVILPLLLQQLVNCSQSLQAVHLQLLLQLTCIIPNVTTFRSNLLRLHQLVYDTNVCNYFKYHALLLLFQRKLLAVYKGKIKDDDRSSLSLRETYRLVQELESLEDEENYLDIHMPLRVKKIYNTMNNSMLNVISHETSIAHLLANNTSNSVRFHSLYHLNIMVYRENEKVERTVEEYIEESKNNCYTSFLLGALLYFKTIRYYSDKSKAIFQIYKMKQLANERVRVNQLNAVTSINMLKTSAFFEVSVEKGQTGEILDYNHGFEKILGAPPRGVSLIGLNMNKLMPSVLQAPHQIYMTKMQKFIQLNIQRFFFIECFDGELREIRFIVKIVPTFNKCLSSAIYVRPFQIEDKVLVVVDKNFEVVGSQKKFKERIEHCKSATEFKNMTQVCHRLCQFVKLIKSFKAYLELVPQLPPTAALSDTEKHARSLRKDLQNLFNTLDYSVKGPGLVFCADVSSPFIAAFRTVQMQVGIEFTSFREIELTKLYFSFEHLKAAPDENARSNRRKVSDRPRELLKCSSIEGEKEVSKISRVVRRRNVQEHTTGGFVEEVLQMLKKHGVLEVGKVHLDLISHPALGLLIASTLALLPKHQPAEKGGLLGDTPPQHAALPRKPLEGDSLQLMIPKGADTPPPEEPRQPILEFHPKSSKPEIQSSADSQKLSKNEASAFFKLLLMGSKQHVAAKRTSERLQSSKLLVVGKRDEEMKKSKIEDVSAQTDLSPFKVGLDAHDVSKPSIVSFGGTRHDELNTKQDEDHLVHNRDLGKPTPTPASQHDEDVDLKAIEHGSDYDISNLTVNNNKLVHGNTTSSLSNNNKHVYKILYRLMVR